MKTKTPKDKELLDKELHDKTLEDVSGGEETTYPGSGHAHEPDLPKVAIENQEEHKKGKDE